MELLQFRHSPYNEKVRWALDLKRVPHRRRSLLPGPHVPVLRPLTGRSWTPVLVTEDGALDGSARLLAWLEVHYPEPALYPADPALRAEALEIERCFDEDFTPRIRRALLDALLRQPASFASVFGDGRPSWQRRLYALTLPLASPLVRRANGIVDAAAIADGIAAGHEALDFVTARAQAGYLCGQCLSVADLAAAATLAVLVQPEHSPMSAPQPLGSEFSALIERYASHPAAGWVREIYARHRGATRDFEGPSV